MIAGSNQGKGCVRCAQIVTVPSMCWVERTRLPALDGGAQGTWPGRAGQIAHGTNSAILLQDEECSACLRGTAEADPDVRASFCRRPPGTFRRSAIDRPGTAWSFLGSRAVGRGRVSSLLFYISYCKQWWVSCSFERRTRQVVVCLRQSRWLLLSMGLPGVQ